MLRRLFPLLLLGHASLALAAPAPAARQEESFGGRTRVGVELSPGVDIPFKKYLDFGSGQDRYSMENGAGFGLGLAVTLNTFELRWSYSRLSAGRVQARLPGTLVESLRLLGREVEPELELEAQGALVLHSFTAGYRIGFAPTPRLRLAIPIGLGLVIAEPPAFGIVHYALFGIGSFAGFLAELQLGRHFSLGAGVRFSIYVTEPDPNLAGAGIAATEQLFDNAVAWLPMLSLTAHFRVHY